MASNFEAALEDVVKKVGQYLDNISKLTVTTRFVEIGGDMNFDTAKPVAQTTLNLDGDSETILPGSTEAGALTLRQDLLDIHRQNVATAIAYRSQMMSALLSALTAGQGGG
ncbi:MAG: hypothetical protein SGI73_09395 [Chloroflexota bacterium]|nr:hypothetical protein [Chloroflexota bacterium]